jgi:hypothetical protein
MKNRKAGILMSGHTTNHDIKLNSRLRPYFFLILLFVISFIYFLLFGNYVFFFQENQSLFIFSAEYLKQYVIKPGGLLEYAGNFIAQGFFSYTYGSLVVSVINILISITFLRIIIKILPVTPFMMFYAVLPSCLLLLLQTDYNYMIYNSLGFLMISIYFMFSIVPERRSTHIFLIGFFPVFYYLTGAYAWIYLGMYIFHFLLNKRVVYTILILVSALITLILSRKVLFFQPLADLLLYPLPLKDYFSKHIIFYLPIGLFIIYPALIKAVSFLRIKEEYLRIFPLYSILILFSLTIFIQSRLYSRNDADLLNLEKLFFEQDWDGVVKLQEDIRMNNIVAQYYYNTALSQKEHLCDRMFYGPQNFGPNSLLVQWNSKTSINDNFRGAYFFYTIGLINEAHRWAFESMVGQGYRPENIKLLIKTNLINDHYDIAEKYINVLKKTMHYRKLALKFEAMLNQPEKVKSDPELGKEIMLMPKEDFLVRIKDQQANILLLLESNTGNRRAFEYMMAWYMLERSIGNVAGELTKMKGIGYTRIPKHLEEAALYLSSNSVEPPDLGGLVISTETKNRFLQYEAASLKFNSTLSANEINLKKAFGSTFWYYIGMK